jgi:[ribosomal protein S5]-alanine N-acetyltransferase
MPTVPESVRTERLHLRRPRTQDAGAVFEYASDPEVVRYADYPRALTVAEIEDRIASRAPNWDAAEEFFWLVTLSGDDRAIGGASLRVEGHEAELGYVLSRAHWRKGLGTEIARFLVALAFSFPDVRRLSATCDAENVASARVLEKCGLVREALLRLATVRPNISAEPRDTLLYALTRDGWTSSRDRDGRN